MSEFTPIKAMKLHVPEAIFPLPIPPLLSLQSILYGLGLDTVLDAEAAVWGVVGAILLLQIN